MEKILVTRSSMPPMEEYVEEIKDLWESHWLTNMGVKHQRLEGMLKAYMQVKNIALCVNGHMSLETILSAMELKGEVITTPFTFVSTVNAIVRCGLKPVFCDINEKDYTIDTAQIERFITPNTTAIVPVHVYGHICNNEEIMRIARKYNLKIIYDAAHAFGVYEDGKSVAAYGDASIFSFHATKVFHTIEGGAIVYNDTGLKDRINNIKNFGITGEESVEYIGGNAKMNEFQAAMGICNLRHIDEEIGKRQKVYEEYLRCLDGVDDIVVWKIPDTVKYNYAYFPILIKGKKGIRDKVYDSLKNNNIFSRKYFYPIVSAYDCYKDIYHVEDTPVAQYVSEHILTLPMYADLTVEQVRYITESVKCIMKL